MSFLGCMQRGYEMMRGHYCIHTCSFAFKGARLPHGHTPSRLWCSGIYGCTRQLILDFFCNFKDRFLSDHKNHYITFTLLTEEMADMRAQCVHPMMRAGNTNAEKRNESGRSKNLLLQLPL